MAKSDKVLKIVDTKLIQIGSSFYLLVPHEILKDTSFPFHRLSDSHFKIKMLKDKLIVEEE